MGFTAVIVAIGWWLLAVQTVMLLLLFARLAPGRNRRNAVEPMLSAARHDTTVSVVIATLNEVNRLAPCLEGLRAQPPIVHEVLVVDSNSTDGTRDLVARMAIADPRIRLIADDTPPADWIGKVWALELGLRSATGTWVLGLDADTRPKPGMVNAVIAAAEEGPYDVVSFAPRFVDQTAGEQFVQPAMLTTLVYRCGAVGAREPQPERVMANGQCFLARRDVLLANNGYAPAQHSFSDDVTLARHLAMRGVRVGFLDGARIIDVRSYASLAEMWREWGRSFDLKDSTPTWTRWMDVVLVWAMQALPLPLVIGLLWAWRVQTSLGNALAMTPMWADALVQSPLFAPLLALNVVALSLRLSMLVAMRHSYASPGVGFWCSWLADIAAAIRLTWSTMRTPHSWRGRRYAPNELSA